MGLLERIEESRRPAPAPAPARPRALGLRGSSRSSVDAWISEYLIPATTLFGWQGRQYVTGLAQTLPGARVAEIAATLPAYTAAVSRCPPAFAAELVRAAVLSQARFTYRNLPWLQPTPRKLHGDKSLLTLERPWPGGTTGDLLARMEWHAGLAGNSFVFHRGRLRVLRPDWVAVVHGSQLEPEAAEPGFAIDAELVGYVYANGGFGVGEPRTLLPEEVAHWAPIPDPLSPAIGMSWITPAVREMQGDSMATEHKLKFFASGGTPNLVVKGLPAETREEFDELVDMLEERHAGLANAYRTLYLTGGADATVVGSNLQQIDFKQTQGAGETRISILSRVPATILGISEGLAGSSLNAGNFSQARRLFADSWVYPSLQNLAATLAPLVEVPVGSELWFDSADMPLLREDAKDAAEIEEIKARTIWGLVKEGFTWQSAIAAVTGQNMNLLKHTGLVSVQLQPPGTAAPAAPAAAPALPAPNGQGQPAAAGAGQGAA